jgi:hypothetical protein
MSFVRINPVYVGEIPFDQTQGTQIDERSFSYIPLSPLVNARLYDGHTVLTRITLLLFNKVSPTLHNLTLVNDDILSLTYFFDHVEKTQPDKVYIYYAEVPFSTMKKVTKVQVNVHNGDPETSRGTVTTVQES